MDTSFPFLLDGWSVGVRNGRYRAGKDECGWTELFSGKRGMVRAGGSASRIIGDCGVTDPGGGKGTRGGGGDARRNRTEAKRTP